MVEKTQFALGDTVIVTIETNTIYAILTDLENALFVLTAKKKHYSRTWCEISWWIFLLFVD